MIDSIKIFRLHIILTLYNYHLANYKKIFSFNCSGKTRCGVKFHVSLREWCVLTCLSLQTKAVFKINSPSALASNSVPRFIRFSEAARSLAAVRTNGCGPLAIFAAVPAAAVAAAAAIEASRTPSATCLQARAAVTPSDARARVPANKL